MGRKLGLTLEKNVNKQKGASLLQEALSVDDGSTAPDSSASHVTVTTSKQSVASVGLTTPTFSKLPTLADLFGAGGAVHHAGPSASEAGGVTTFDPSAGRHFAGLALDHFIAMP